MISALNESRHPLRARRQRGEGYRAERGGQRGIMLFCSLPLPAHGRVTRGGAEDLSPPGGFLCSVLMGAGMN